MSITSHKVFKCFEEKFEIITIFLKEKNEKISYQIQNIFKNLIFSL